MPTLTLRNLSNQLYDRLKTRAERNRRSMNNEVLALLEEALLPTPIDTESLISEAEAADAWFERPLPDLIARGIREGRRYESDRPVIRDDRSSADRDER